MTGARVRQMMVGSSPRGGGRLENVRDVVQELMWPVREEEGPGITSRL